MALNALYGGEPGNDERKRLMRLVRRSLSRARARRILSEAKVPIERLVYLPPGDMRLEIWDPAFRRASQRLTRQYREATADPISRVAAVAGILYQIRCNLVHGSKDPDVDRDHDLVKHSLHILLVMLPALEGSVIAA